jgi:hypothetical protein
MPAAAALAIVGGAGWLATTARAQGDQVLTYQMSLGIPNLAGDGGLPGSADGQFVFPKGIAIDSTGRFIVADTESWDGVVVSSIGSRSRAGRHAGDSFGVPATCPQSFVSNRCGGDATDRIIVTDTDNHRIQVFSPANTRDVDDVDGDPIRTKHGPCFWPSSAHSATSIRCRPDVWDLDGDGDPTETDPTHEPYDPGTAPLDRFIGRLA